MTKMFKAGRAAVLVLVATLPALLFASGKNKDFPLRVPIVRIERQPAGLVLLDGVALATSSRIFTVHIDGDPRELTMTPYSMRFLKGSHVGDYSGHWNTNGSLEIQCLDEKGKLVHWRFLPRGERLLLLLLLLLLPPPPRETTPK
jgi:hypothetical protein